MRLPDPPEVRAQFLSLMHESAEEAVQYLYNLGTASGYIKEEELAKNIYWKAASSYGEIECTINLAKPEKDPRSIAAEAQKTTAPCSPTDSASLSHQEQKPLCHPEQKIASHQKQRNSSHQEQKSASHQEQNSLCHPEQKIASHQEQKPLCHPEQSEGSFTLEGAPQCDLCWENEEFRGTAEHPAKPGLRIAPLTLGGELWGLQYSPYAYFNEHCIALSREHRPMRIDTACLERLLDFVDQFPFYFIGANADLPIVGGSILSHDHFQGGRHVFPLMKAPLARELELQDFPQVQCGIVKWPASVLRLTSENREELLAAASRILVTWSEFSYEAGGIIAFSERHQCSETRPTSEEIQCNEPNPKARELQQGAFTSAMNKVQHNTLNPIVRKQGSKYIMDLVLRNNRTDEQHPWGIFHAPEWTHYIKKENIGLIEIMGLAILPPRLLTELPQIQDKNDHATRQKVADVFVAILEATGVFKHDATGRAGWDIFISRLNSNNQ